MEGVVYQIGHERGGYIGNATVVGSASFVELTSYEAGLARVVNPLEAPLTTYYHTDMLGATRLMSDHAANKVNPVVYTAFGEQTSGSTRRYGHAGAWEYQTDVRPGSTPPTSDMPFLHIGHRYYDPSTGRFLQRDPIGIRGGQNVYEYVESSPLAGVDPSGLHDGGPSHWSKHPPSQRLPRPKPKPSKPSPKPNLPEPINTLHKIEKTLILGGPGLAWIFA